jgi:outer membrane protein
MRKLLVVISGLAMLLGVQIASAVELKVAVVDLSKILASAPQVAAMRTKLQNQFDPRNKELMELGKTIQTEGEKYNKDSAVMKDQEKKDMQVKLTSQQKKFVEMQGSFQKDLMAEETKAMQEISKQIQEVVDGIAKKKGYNLVLAKGAVAYNDVSFEITDEVLSALKSKK